MTRALLERVNRIRKILRGVAPASHPGYEPIPDNLDDDPPVLERLRRAQLARDEVQRLRDVIASAAQLEDRPRLQALIADLESRIPDGQSGVRVR